MIVNLTPHSINVIDRAGLVTLSIPPSGKVARLGTTESGSAVPPMQVGTWYVVSLPTALGVRGRLDLVTPYVEVRDDDGRILGCRALAQVAP